MMKTSPARDPVELVVSEKHARLLYQLLPAFFAAFVLNLFLQIPDKLHSRTSYYIVIPILYLIYRYRVCC